MADNETDTVDLAFLQLATEIAFGPIIQADDLAKLKHKAGSFALLESDVREGHRRFPHTEISHHFLASSLIRRFGRGDHVTFLRKGTVAADFLAIFLEAFVKMEADPAREFASRLETLLLTDVGSCGQCGGNPPCVHLPSECD
jgi:hypothetical protein